MNQVSRRLSETSLVVISWLPSFGRFLLVAQPQITNHPLMSMIITSVISCLLTISGPDIFLTIRLLSSSNFSIINYAVTRGVVPGRFLSQILTGSR